MKKILLSALTAAFLLMASAAAQADYTEGYFSYVIEKDVAVITGYFGDEAEVTVPAQLAGYPVCAVAEGAFSGETKVTSVRLPETAQTYEEKAFSPIQEVSVQSKEVSAQNNEFPAERVTVQPAADAAADSLYSEKTETARNSAGILSGERIENTSPEFIGLHSFVEDAILPGISSSLQSMDKTDNEGTAAGIGPEVLPASVPLAVELCAGALFALFVLALAVAAFRAAKKKRRKA